LSSLYNGNGANPLPAVGANFSFSIASSTNPTGSPVKITTTPTNTFSTGDTVEIEGHSGNTTIPNGFLGQITVIDAHNFTLNGTVGNGGATGTGGIAIDYAITPQITIPGDTDPANASSVNVPFEALEDLAPFNYRNAGKFRLYNYYQNYVQVTPSTPFAGWTSTLTFSTGAGWVDVSDGTITMTTLFASAIPYIAVGDVVEVQLNFSFSAAFQSGQSEIAFGLASRSNGAGSNTLINNGVQQFATNATGNQLASGASLYAILSPGSALDSTYFGCQVFINTGMSTSTAISIFKGWTATLKHWRKN
jgi:hypothetical protein